MRPVSFERNYVKNPAGSCLASFGDTKVICTCSIEEGKPPFVSSGGWLTAEYAMLPGSVSAGRKKRDGAKRDGRSVEIQRLIGRSLRAALNLSALPPVTLTVDCDVLQADGGTRTAAISGGWVALVDALAVLAETLGESGEAQGPKTTNPPDAAGIVAAPGRPATADLSNPRLSIPERWLLGRVAAVSVGIVAGEVVCDLDYEADRNAEVDMNVVTLEGNYVEIQGTGEKGIFDKSRLDDMLAAADGGLSAIAVAQDAALSRG